ncbi:MAG: hypothetical protein PHI53_01595 [Candidatus Pacebacteria bacterium]|nr:hypothetical protein [Candidatus Paceibacterota bacterium]
MHQVSGLDRAKTIPSDEGIRKSEKKTVKQFLISHIRCLATEILNLLFNYNWVFWLIGLINKKISLIESVFLVYPANENYISAYAYHYRSRWHEWKPGPIGIFWQNGKLGIKFAISAHNGQFRNPENKEKLRRVVLRMEEIRKFLYAKRKTFAGILPGILFTMRMIREVYEAEVTVKVVKQVMEKIRLLEGLKQDTPIIILGGRGFVGRKLVAALSAYNIFSVDIAGGRGKYDWPSHLFGKPVLLVNISLNSVITDYLDLLWSKVVVINEVYPEPSKDTVRHLRKIGCHCYHIVGVDAKALPSFPHGYQGGIPCCAAWPSENMKALFLRVV